MTPDFSSTILEKKVLKLLKSMAKHPTPLTPDNERDIKDLCELGFASSEYGPKDHISPNLRYKITQLGRLYIRYRNQSSFRFALPVIISIISLLISICAMVMSFQG